MKNLKTNIFIIIVIALLNYSLAFAWEDKTTHPALTDRAIKHLQETGWIEPYFQNNLGFKKHVEKFLNNGGKDITIIDLLLEGSREEDRPLSRAKNHFHNPLQATNEAGLDQPKLKGESALAWARGDTHSNEYSWLAARTHR